MVTLSIHDCEIDMRVLLTNPDDSYVINRGNPKVDTEYECEGTIAYISEDEDYVEVLWDNGSENTYSNHELSLVDEVNMIGRCEDIWLQI